MNKNITETLSQDFHSQTLPFEKIKLISTKKFKIPLNSILVEKNPVLNLEIWQDEQGNQIVSGQDFLVTRKDKRIKIEHLSAIQNDILYGIIRTELTRLIRKKELKESYLAFHAGLIRYHNKVIMIIGDKGMGKTSSCLYFLEHGGEIFTDELVFFSPQRIKVLSRMISIDEHNLTNYFPRLKKDILIKSKSMLNLETKYILNTKLKDRAVHNIDKVLLLVDKDSSTTEKLAYLKKKKILASQLIPTQISSSENAIDLLANLVDKAEVTTVSNIKKRLEQNNE